MLQLNTIKTLRRFKDDLLDFIYPQSCPICKKSLDQNERDICNTCWTNLIVLPHSFCPYCMSFFKEDGSIFKHGCDSPNQPGDRRILAVRSLGTFDDYYKTLIHRIKYDKKIPLGKLLAKSLGEVIAKEKEFIGCDLVIPVPLHRARKRERGFNQSEILAEGISKSLNITFSRNILRRTKNTKDQTHLNAQQRQENVRNAFKVALQETVIGKNVILVDDVMTTGATLNECARVLLDAGAKRVLAATLAVVVD
jgi:competence protein ComFC